MTLDAGVRLNRSREGVSYICTDGTCTLDVRLRVVVDIVTQRLASRGWEGGIRRVGRRDFGTCRTACQWPMTHDGMMRGLEAGLVADLSV